MSAIQQLFAAGVVAGGGGGGGSTTLVYSSPDSASSPTPSIDVTTGNYYVVASWDADSTVLTVDGSSTGVTSLPVLGGTLAFRLNGYAPGSSGSKVFAAGRILFVFEVPGVTGFNGSTTETLSTNEPTGEGTLTGIGTVFAVDTSGEPTSVDMTSVGVTDSGAGPFYAFTTSGSVDPNMDWTVSSGFNRLGGAGLT